MTSTMNKKNKGVKELLILLFRKQLSVYLELNLETCFSNKSEDGDTKTHQQQVEGSLYMCQFKYYLLTLHLQTSNKYAF